MLYQNLQFPSGIKALQKLLEGTTRVRSQSKYHRRYFKDGDVNMAYKDFYSVNPEMVSKQVNKGVSDTF